MVGLARRWSARAVEPMRRMRAMPFSASALAAAWGGDAANIWREGTCEEVERRVRDLPGFGPLKAKKLKHTLYYFGHRDLSED